MVGQRIQEVWAYRELLWALAYRDIRVKYKQAVMGVAWAFFLPLLAIASGVIVRIAMARFSGQDWPDMSQVAQVMIMWLRGVFFAGAVGASSGSLLGNMGLITKIYFPREVVPLSALVSQLFDFLVSVVGLVAMLVILPQLAGSGDSGGGGGGSAVLVTPALLWLPVLMLLLVLLSAGLGMVLGCANLFFRDVKYIVDVVLRFGIFFTPVYLSISEYPKALHKLLLLNPVAPILEAMGSAATRGMIDPWLWPWLAYSAAVTVVGLFAAWIVFDRAQYLFAEYA